MKKWFFNPISNVKTYGVDEKLTRSSRGVYKLLGAGTNIIDAYILARMFRTYPNTNHSNSNLRIVYIGSAHTVKYVDFFQNILNVNVRSFKYKSKARPRCIEVDSRDFLEYISIPYSEYIVYLLQSKVEDDEVKDNLVYFTLNGFDYKFYSIIDN